MRPDDEDRAVRMVDQPVTGGAEEQSGCVAVSMAPDDEQLSVLGMAQQHLPRDGE